MKKWQLLKICEYINTKKLKYTSYNDLLALTDEQIDLIINNIDRETIPVLIEFFSLLNKGKYDFTKFEELGIINIEKIMINRILYSDEKEEAILNLYWFRYKIDKIKSKEEWFTFMHNLSSEISISNLSYVIDNFENLRIETIEKVMKNSHKLRTIYLCDINKKKRLKEKNLLDIIDLVIMGYNEKLSTKLIKQLVKIKQENIVYDTILNYLRNPKLFHENLPKVFIDIDIAKLTNVIETLEKIDNPNILDSYLSFDFKREKLEILNNYINKIIQKEESKLKESMVLLLDKKDVFEDKDKLNIAVEKLEEIDIDDERNIILTKLLEVIPYDKWIGISFDLGIDKLEYIYQNNKTFLDIINFLDISFVVDRFRKLSLINIRKIFAVFRLKKFSNELKKNYNIDKLFDLFNEKMIDTSYKKYLLEEEKNKLLERSNITRIDTFSEIELTKLYNILENGYDIELVLDNYQDDDEITSNTLIKTLS